MFPHERRDLRAFFARAWSKHGKGEPLEPLERQLAELIGEHPEYHALLEDERALERDWTPEHGQTNPFLHLGMHMAVREQVATDRPPGIREAWQHLGAKLHDPHEAEHSMMEALGEALWQAQRDNRMPDERAYLAAVRRLAGLPQRSDDA